MKKIKSICIIDDDPITVFGITRMLKNMVACENISTFPNGKLAIDGLTSLFHENREMPELILLDINMPIMDGWQFLEEFIRLPIEQEVYINIITSSIDPIDLQKSEMYKLMTSHAIAYTNKPLRKEEIEEVISKV